MTLHYALCGSWFPLWGAGATTPPRAERPVSVCGAGPFREKGRRGRFSCSGGGRRYPEQRPIPPESAFFGRIHTVLRGIGAVSERYVTLNLKRYRAFFP